MKLTSLLISILVFLMSGVMCLFSTSEVFAQVPQTKRGDQDSFLKNIRAKKRNNDLQKARQQKRNLDSSDDWKIRIRHQSGEYNEEEGENRSDYKKDVTDVKIWTLIIGKIGFSNLKQDYYSIRDVSNNSELIAFNKTNLESTILSYTFGNNITLTIGTTIENKGNISIGEKSLFSGLRNTLPLAIHTLFTVNSPLIDAITTFLSLASKALSTIRVSPVLIPASDIDSPSTLTKKVADGFFMSN